MSFRLSTSAIGPWLFACGCVLVVALAVWVRFLPAGGAANPTFFRTDSAFHLRMLSYVVETGTLPENDPLFDRNPPRKLAHIGPPNLYTLTAAVFQAARRLGLERVDFSWFFLLFNSLCSALPVIGCGWVVWEVSGGKQVETTMGMILCAVASPMFLRSHAGIFRHETIAVGLLLILTGILFHGIQRENRVFWSWMAAICVFVGMGFWRLFPWLAAVVMLGILLADFLWPGHSRPWLIIDACALGCLAAVAAYAFYRTNLSAAAAYFLPVLVMPVLQRLAHRSRGALWREKLLARKAGLLAALILLILAGSLAVPALRVRWQAAFYSAPLPLTSATLYGVLVEELAPLPLSGMLSASFFSYLPILLVAAWFLLRGRGKLGRLARAASITFLIFMTLTVFVVRFISLAFPLLVVCLIPALSASIGAWKENRFRWLARIDASILGAGLLIPAAVFYLREDLRLAEYLRKPDPDQAAACEWLRLNVPADENVVAEWSHGYEIQTFSGRRTVMDGYLEDPLNRARILGLLHALLATDESELSRYMKEQNGKYLLLDRIYFLPTCRRLNLPWRDWLEIQDYENFTRISLKPQAERNNYVKCLFDPGRLKQLRVIFNAGNYVVLRLEPAN